MLDRDWNMLSENFAEFQKLVSRVITDVHHRKEHSTYVDSETCEALVGIAIALNGCLDGGNITRLNSDIVEFHFGISEDEIDEDDQYEDEEEDIDEED